MSPEDKLPMVPQPVEPPVEPEQLEQVKPDDAVEEEKGDSSDLGSDETDMIVDVGQDETETETPEPAPAPKKPVRVPTLTPVLSRTSDALWGPDEQPKAKPASDLDDLFDVPEEDDNDMYTDDLFEVEEEDIDMEDDLSDLTRVTDEDIMGKPPRPRQPPQRFRRTSRPYNPPSSMGGLR